MVIFQLRFLPIYSLVVGLIVTPQITVDRNLDPIVLTSLLLAGIAGGVVTQAITPQIDMRAIAARVIMFAGFKDITEGIVKSVRFHDSIYAYAHTSLFAQWLIVALGIWLVGYERSRHWILIRHRT